MYGKLGILIAPLFGIGMFLFIGGFTNVVETWSLTGLIPGIIGLAMMATAVLIQNHT